MVHQYEEKTLVFRKGRTIYFFDEIAADSICEAIKLLQEIENESSNKPINIILKSEGGDCYDGFALYDKIRQSEYDIIITGTGIVASMATIVFLAGDTRILTENTRLMIHQVYTGSEGKCSDAKIDIKETETLQNRIIDIISERTGQSRSKITKEFKIGDKWLSAEEAKEDGYADEILINIRTRRRRKKKK